MAVFVVDRPSILERLGGDEELYGVMAEMFVADLETNCASLAQVLAAGDFPALQREVHTVKGLLATFSDSAGAEQAQLLEDQVRQGMTEGLAAAIASLDRRLREVAAALAADLG